MEGIGPSFQMNDQKMRLAKMTMGQMSEVFFMLFIGVLLRKHGIKTILLVAIIAAIVLTMRRRKGLKVQDIGAQVATRREDRLRILQMPAEKKE